MTVLTSSGTVLATQTATDPTNGDLTATVTGLTAGATYYAGKIAGSLFNMNSAAQQAAMVGNIAKTGGFLKEMGKSATEMALMTGMEGMFESGMAAFDPAMPAAVPFTVLIAANGDVLFQQLGELDFMKLRRAILANLPDDKEHPGMQAHWSAQ